MNGFDFLIAALALILIYSVIITALRYRGRRSGEPRTVAPEDEAQLLVEIRQGLARMEKRVEALETLLADQQRAHETSTSKKQP